MSGTEIRSKARWNEIDAYATVGVVGTQAPPLYGLIIESKKADRFPVVEKKYKIF